HDVNNLWKFKEKAIKRFRDYNRDIAEIAKFIDTAGKKFVELMDFKQEAKTRLVRCAELAKQDKERMESEIMEYFENEDLSSNMAKEQLMQIVEEDMDKCVLKELMKI
ncbi:hypothetical protein RUND412_006433, partial [Rhizina undulata]